MASNLLLSRWSGQGVNLWTIDLQTVSLVQGTATYSVPANTVAILDAYVTTGTGTAATNRIMLPISRSEYASYPQPQQQGMPTVYWFDRLLSPTITLYLTPDGTQVSFSYYRMTQIQDANFTDGQQVDVPYYFLEAFAIGLASRLAMIYSPERAAALKAEYAESYSIATNQNTETASFYVSPQISGYFRV